MLDLSNNNGPVDFRKVYHAGHRRVYLKKTEGLGFNDKTFWPRRQAAIAAGLRVGAYHFGHPENDPRREAQHFASGLVLQRHKDLRPCLDFEVGNPNPRWANAFVAEVRRLTGVKPILYSFPAFLRSAMFGTPPAELWLAAFGRNDGREYPFEIPRPWSRVCAHQYASRARVPGCTGDVDISRVVNGKALELPLFRWRG